MAEEIADRRRIGGSSATSDFIPVEAKLSRSAQAFFRAMIVPAALIPMLISGCGVRHNNYNPTPSPIASIRQSSLPPAPSGSAAGKSVSPPSYLLNPAVQQSTISSTICKSGWTATIRPPVSFTEPLKIKQLKDSKVADQNPAHYEEDHWIPLELGGAPREPRNLRPEPWFNAGLKDQVENSERRDVCDGKKTLATARQELYMEWRNR